MLKDLLAEFYDRDIQKLMEEISLFKQEENLWKTAGAVKNTAGNIALHVIGGSHHLIGNILLHTGYVRNRDEEFTRKDVERSVLIAQLEEVVTLVHHTLEKYTSEQLSEEYPAFFDKPNTTISYVLLQLLLHLNYHTGQVNYLRRILEN